MHRYYVEALVQSKSDVDKLIQRAKSKLAELVEMHEQYMELTREDEKGVTHLTRESGILSEEFQYAGERLGKYLEDELAALSELLWKQITRPEESRKFTRMRNALEKIIYPYLGDPDGYYYDKISVVTDPEKYVEPTIKTLRYLKNYWHRIERYQKVQREIKHGPFTLLNEYGYQPGEYDQEITYFDEAATRVGKVGLDELLYGKVVLTTTHALGENTIGLYDPRYDEVQLAVDWVSVTEDKREAPVPVLIHEFGHRLWQKFMPFSAKSAYVSAYGWMSGEDLKSLWQRLVDNNFSLARSKKGLTPELQQELDRRWKKAVKATTKYQEISVKELRKVLSGEELALGPESSQWRVVVKPEDVLKQLQRVFLDLGVYHQGTDPLDYYEPKVPTDVRSVTWYGKTNPEEDFCEAFMFFCMGWKMDSEFEERLVNALAQAEADK